MVGMFICLPSIALAEQGTATFYTPPYVPSSCNGFKNDGVMIAAASNAIWNNRAACGRRYRVKCIGGTNNGVQNPCTGNSVLVKIVDYCPPPGCRGTIDLSQQAFAVIANPDAGKIRVQFTQ
ncbi:EG45-like domain containing protein 2 [Forsythia ovata]|uniref:EG45-like domain containing protein 2 n=1 Tax=Forsythia ovata TaxID=205694 RepID=A0ABD1SNQ2_9LAMI